MEVHNFGFLIQSTVKLAKCRLSFPLADPSFILKGYEDNLAMRTSICLPRNTVRASGGAREEAPSLLNYYILSSAKHTVRVFLNATEISVKLPLKSSLKYLF